MIVSIASGKGGTGKTTVAVNMALSLNRDVQLLDCDVEEPNAHIFLKPKIDEIKPVTIPVPKVDDELCDYCGKCADFCEFNAIAVLPNNVMVFPNICHGCGGCLLICPNKAISEENRQVGVVKVGSAGSIEFAHGELNIGEPMSGPLIKEVKKNIKSNKITIIDAPPGTSCPVIESIYGSDYCILATEPTPFGFHDLKLMVGVLREIKIPFGIIINRAEIGDKKVYEYCKKERIPILLEIPFSRKIAELYSQGIPFTTVMQEWKKKFLALYSTVKESLTK